MAAPGESDPVGYRVVTRHDSELHAAAANGDVDALKDLLCIRINKKAIDKADNRGFAPLHLAVKEGQAMTVRTLLEAGAKANVSTATAGVNTPLHLAVKLRAPAEIGE